MDYLDKMDKFIETHNLPKLNQEESENMNRQIIPSEIEAVIKNLPTNRRPGPDGFTGEFYQVLQEEYLSFSNYFKNFNRTENSQAHYEVRIILILKPDKTLQKKRENYKQLSLMNVDTNILNKVLAS